MSVKVSVLPGSPMRSILPDKTRSGVWPDRNSANLILDDPALIVRMKDFGFTVLFLQTELPPLFLHDQNRAMGVSKRALGHAAQYETLEARFAVASHED